MAYGKKTLKRRTYKRKSMYKGSPKVSTTIRKYVKATLHKNIENKVRYNYSSNQPIQTGSSSTMTWPMIPTIDQGQSSGNRIGNIIKPVKGVWKCVINLLPYDVTTNNLHRPVWVKIWIVKDTAYQLQIATMNNNSFANFFNGNGTALSFQNNCLDMVLDNNTDNFKVMKVIQFKLGSASNFSGNYPGGSNDNFSDNSPTAKQITINYTKYIKKALKFQDNTTYTINNNLYFVIQAVPCDGADATSQKLIEMHYTNRFQYEDA